MKDEGGGQYPEVYDLGGVLNLQGLV
jgi:hypothetical protein